MNIFRSIFILFLLLTGISFTGFSQIDTVFLNKSGQKCSRIDAKSYRIFTPDSMGFVMHQYRMNDSLKITGHYKTIAPNEVRDGQFVEYMESGEVMEEIVYVNGSKSGVNTRYYPGKKPWFIGEFAAGLQIGEHRWFNEDGSKHRIEKYSNGKLIDGFCYTKSGVDTSYFPEEELAEFPGKQEALYKFIAKNVKYPKECIENEIEGRVFVKFVINQQGKITDCQIIRSVHPLLDAEALRVVNSMPLWRPAMMEGKPVKIEFNLPINFKLQ
jgi:TonB family protein